MPGSQTVSRRCTQILLALAFAAGAVGISVPTASAAPQCVYDGGTRTATVTLTSVDGSLEVRANGTFLEVADVFCATLTEVNTVTINAAARPDVRLIFDLATGPLGPGNFNEGNGSSEIEFTVNALGPTSVIHIFGTPGNDKVTLGWLFNRTTGYSEGEINLNAFADGATVDNDISFPSLPGEIIVDAGTGDDVISGAGTGTFSTQQIYVPLSLNGDLGSNQVTGGGGNDSVYFREMGIPDGPDTLGGGGGFDTAFASVSGEPPATASLSLDGIANDGSLCPGGGCNGDNIGMDFEAIEGSRVDEVITGNSGPQTLSGGLGDDVVWGLGGSDILICGQGTYLGGAGKDVIARSGRRTSPDCGVMSGGKGFDTADFTESPPVTVTVDDVANDAGGSTNVRKDIEKVIGSPNDDTLTGNGRKNVLDGGAGNDTLQGLGGADTLIPGLGIDTVSGGPGVDILSYATAAAGITLDAAVPIATGEGTDTFDTIESYVGSALADLFMGSGAGERMAGGAGDDDLGGRGGADTLLGDADNDSLNGGSGVDTCSQGDGTGPVINCEG